MDIKPFSFSQIKYFAMFPKSCQTYELVFLKVTVTLFTDQENEWRWAGVKLHNTGAAYEHLQELCFQVSITMRV